MASVFRTLALFLLTIGGIDATDSVLVSLQSRWRSLQVNCTHQAPAPVDSVSVAEATAILNSHASASQWLHDIGEWHVLHNGDMSQAEQFLRASADQGHADAQFLVGALIATDVDRTGDADAALFYHFAAQQGSPLAAMALGYRHLHGYGSPHSCDVALRHYKTTADAVIRHKHGLPNPSLPFQYFTPPPPTQLTDDQTKLPEREGEERQRLDYLRVRSASSTSPDLLVRTASLVLFSDIYQHQYTHDDRVAHTEAVGVLQRAADLGSGLATALLGHVYAYGIVDGHHDVHQAIALYQSVVASNQTHSPGYAEAANGLGRIFFHGLGGVAIDYERAMGHFKDASRSGHADAVFNAAVLMANANPERSQRHLEEAAAVGHVEAIFRLARTTEKRMFRGQQHNCDTVTKLYKRVADHNQHGLKVMRAAAEAYLDSRIDHAIRLYLIAAELGYEAAELNAVWLMERYQFTSLLSVAHDRRFTQLVARGMAQNSVDAFVLGGDLAFALGNYRHAMQQYLSAIHLAPRHARALYSAGYMCEHGLGTISRNRNLARARGYYERAQQEEPVLTYLLTLLTWRIDAKLHLETFWMWLHSWSKEKPVVAADEAVAIAPSIQPAHTSREVVFASALAFDGANSRVVVDSEGDAAAGDVTVDLWLWIENPSGSDGEGQAILEWQDGIAIGLEPHYDGASWQLNVRSLAGASVLVFTDSILAAKRWYHVALIAEDLGDRLAVALAVDGELVDSGSLAHQLPTDSNRLVMSIGQPLSGWSQSVDGFQGQLMNVRIWHTAVQLDRVTRLREMDGCRQDTTLGLCLQPELQAHRDSETLKEATVLRILDHSNRLHHRVVQQRDVGLRMLRFPPLIPQ